MVEPAWTYAVQSVLRVVPDPIEEGERDNFAVTFEVTGPNISIEMEVYVEDVTDEAQIIALAMHHMHASFEALARATASRHIVPAHGAPN